MIRWPQLIDIVPRRTSHVARQAGRQAGRRHNALTCVSASASASVSLSVSKSTFCLRERRPPARLTACAPLHGLEKAVNIDGHARPTDRPTPAAGGGRCWEYRRWTAGGAASLAPLSLSKETRVASKGVRGIDCLPGCLRSVRSRDTHELHLLRTTTTTTM
ncbi:hypothetical protein BKA80DRAFT_49222 [Phyllosticta citrichinensis]